MMWGKHETCYKCRALEDFSADGRLDYRCGLGYSTSWTLSELVPTEECDKPMTKIDLMFSYKRSDKLTAMQRIEKIEQLNQQTKKRVLSKIKCWHCNEIFEGGLPRKRGSFPKIRKCSHCKSNNYMFDFDNGNINTGYSREDASKVTIFGIKLLL
jgi:hypothetical protein